MTTLHIYLPFVVLTMLGCQSDMPCIPTIPCGVPRGNTIIEHLYETDGKAYLAYWRKVLQEDFPIKAGMSLEVLASTYDTDHFFHEGSDDDPYGFMGYTFTHGANNGTGCASVSFVGIRSRPSGECIIEVRNHVVTNVWVVLSYGEFSSGVYEHLSGDGTTVYPWK